MPNPATRRPPVVTYLAHNGPPASATRRKGDQRVTNLADSEVAQCLKPFCLIASQAPRSTTTLPLLSPPPTPPTHLLLSHHPPHSFPGPRGKTRERGKIFLKSSFQESNFWVFCTAKKHSSHTVLIPVSLTGRDHGELRPLFKVNRTKMSASTRRLRRVTKRHLYGFFESRFRAVGGSPAPALTRSCDGAWPPRAGLRLLTCLTVTQALAGCN